jgi:6-phosphogluconolactonase
MRAGTFFAGKSVIALTMLLVAVAAPAREFLVFVGTYTNALSRGIYVSRLDAATGILVAPELAAATPSPSFLALSPGNKFLYAANSTVSFQGKNTGSVSAFALDKNSGRLVFLNQKSSGGSDPCHLSVAGNGGILLVANYNSGSLKSFQLNPDGSVGADGSLILHHGSSINPSRQTAPHAHFICPDPSGRFALACDLGLDKIMIYKIDAAAGTLAEHSFASVPPGSGSRHLAFSPDGKFAHVVNEMGCTVSTFRWNSKSGTLEPVETVSALPPGVAAQPGDTAAEILTVGDQVYATIRGRDEISVFSADPRSGRLTFVQAIPSGGQVPRGLGIDPTHRWLLVGNQKTDNVVEFAIDRKTGKVAPTGRELKIGSPVDVKFVEEN